ncbi:MAG TPA: sulfatase-like hydrolase/transferase [Longimicrobium sp.]|nr:sulfatase-like hydrolase/transferase [Longimicrobium sp.]
MDRRRFVQSLAGAAVLAAVPGCGTSPAARPGPRRRPNVLLIMADDLGYGDLGVTGRTDYSTPVLDRVAREGVQLTQAYSSAPVCTPTRVALLTGRYPARTHAGLFEPLTTHPDGLDPDPPTLGRLMRDAGYETALVGKWHLGTLPKFHPLRHGFDEFYGLLGAAADYTSHLDTESLQNLFQDGTRTVRTEGYLTDLFTERAVRIVSRARSKPLFLNLQYNAPHWPWQAPGDPPYPDSLRWAGGGSPETYARMVASMDAGIGRVLDALRQAGMEGDTLVIFTSDNGGERFSHMGPFSHGKMTLYEGGIRVAAMARWAGRIPAGTRTDHVAVTMDWTATLLALAGAQPPAAAPLDGIDLMPALTGATTTHADRDLYWRISQRRRQKALRSGNWKYLQTEDGEFLFDLAADPGETRDLRADRPDVLAQLTAKYAAWERQVLAPLALDPARA